MKKVLIPFLFLIILIFIFNCIKYSSWSKSLEEALTNSEEKRLTMRILHKYKTDKGIIVFYQQFNNEDLSIAFIKNDFNYYKYVYGGVQNISGGVRDVYGNILDTPSVLDRFGFTFSFYSYTGGISFPVYLGIISDLNIRRIEISDMNETIIKDAEIIDTETEYRVWLLDMTDFEEFKGQKIQIIAYSENNTEVSKMIEQLI